MCILDNGGHERSHRREVKPRRTQGFLRPNGSKIFRESIVLLSTGQRDDYHHTAAWYMLDTTLSERVRTVS